MYLVKGGKYLGIQLLLSQNADLNFTHGGQALLHSGVKNGHPKVIQLLLESKADVDRVGSHEQTPLSDAAAHGHTECA